MQKRLCALIVVALLVGTTTRTEGFELDKLETAELRLLYLDPFQTYLLPHVTRSFHNSLEFQKQIFNWTPYEETTVLLKDSSDYGNAGAAVAPVNAVSVDIAPASHTLETLFGGERFFSLMNHEMVHVATMDVSNSQDRKWRGFFGGKPRETDKHPETILYSYLAAPRFSSPRWYAEGSAVFMETWMTGGVGRAQGGYDEMVFRAKVRDGSHFYSNLGLVSEGTAVDFQVGANAYLYGTRFFSYLGLQYSPEQVIEWLSRGEDSERYYARQFEKVFGKPMVDAWDDWIAFEHEFQNANLERVRQVPLTPVRHLTGRPLGSISRMFYDPSLNALIGAFRYPGVVAHIGVLSLEDGSIRRLADVKGPMLYRVASTAYDPDSRTFFYTADNIRFRDLMAVDVDSGETRMLMQDARIGDLVFNAADRSIWGLRHLNGYVTLVRIPHPYDQWNQVHTWPYGEELFELDLSPDGQLLSTSVGQIDGSQFLRVFSTDDLLSGRVQHIAQFDFGDAIPEGFAFSPDGRYLFGSSYYTGVSNIFRYEIETRELEAVSNAETGFFRPIPLADGRLGVFEYTGEGFVPAVIDDPVPLDDVSNIRFLGSEVAAQHPVVRDWNVARTFSGVRYEDIEKTQGKYRPPRELGYGTGYPVIEGYKDYEALGWNMQFQDPAQLHTIDVTASYSWDDDLPSSERLHARVDYHALNWSVSYWHNDADFYDLFGPTERSRKGDAFLVGYDKSLIFDDPRTLGLSVDLNYYTGLDTLPDNQNVSIFTFEDILTAKLGLHYSNTRKSLGAVDHEKGFRWNLSLSVDNARGETIPKLRGGFDFGFALPWKHSSIWFYNSAGVADGKRLIPLTNYYFGGFGNNWVDDGQVKRYRGYYSLPGWEIGEVSARDFVKTVVEWNLPPKRFREVGTPSFFLKHIRPAIFFGALVADPDKSFERTVTSMGIQLDLEFTLAHRLPMTLSVGYASGFEDGHKHDDEWMVSLKIL